MWIGLFIIIDFVVSPGQMSVTAVVIAEVGVGSIYMLGASWVGILMSWVFFICNEHLAEMLHVFLVYRAVMQDGGFASGWKGVMTLQNCPLASSQILNWWSDISTAIVSSWVIPRYWALMSYHAVKFPCGMSKVNILYIESCCDLSWIGTSMRSKIVCWQREHGCKDICKSAMCLQMALVDAMWVARFPLCVITSS